MNRDMMTWMERRDYALEHMPVNRVITPDMLPSSSTPIQNLQGYTDAAQKLWKSQAEQLLGKRIKPADPQPKENFTIAELAERWNVKSRGTVYNRLRKFKIEGLDFSSPGDMKSKRVVSAKAVYELEKRKTKRFR